MKGATEFAHRLELFFEQGADDSNDLLIVSCSRQTILTFRIWLVIEIPLVQLMGFVNAAN